MKAYLIAVETVHDEVMFAEYRKQVVGSVAPFGGQFIARGGELTDIITVFARVSAAMVVVSERTPASRPPRRFMGPADLWVHGLETSPGG
jgi:uncharacterized protein (DUF1330 family)